MRLLVRRDCPDLTERDRSLMRRLAWETEFDGFERGFAKCKHTGEEDDYTLCTGTECSLRIPSCEREPTVLTYHTHPQTWADYANYFSIRDVANSAYYLTRKAPACLGTVPAKDGRVHVKCIRVDSGGIAEALTTAQQDFNAINNPEDAAAYATMSDLEKAVFKPLLDMRISGVLGRLERAANVCEEVISQ